MYISEMESWNITAEVMRREYGFSDRAEIRARDSNPFHKTILGSYYIVRKIVTKSIIGDKYKNPDSLDFNAKGDLLCVAYDDKQIAVYDWAYNKLKFSFNSGHTKEVADVKLTNNDDSSLNIISTSGDGQLRRAEIRPTGDVVTTCLYHNRKGQPTIAAVPRSPYEYVAVTDDGLILQLDLRCDPKVLPTIQRIPNEIWGFLPLHAVAHHPFVTEFCVGGQDAFLRIFDRRKMNETLREMYPEALKDDSVVDIFQCTYNYDGSEILANFFCNGAYLFDNLRYIEGEYSSYFSLNDKSFQEATFFGPKSEFVLCAQGDGIYIFDKNTREIVKYPEIIAELIDMHDCKAYVRGVRSHPFLPVFASRNHENGVVLWAPAEKRTMLNSDED